MAPSRPGGRQACYKLLSVAHHVNRHALELAGAEHLAYAPRRELEDTGGLIDAVGLLLHAGSILGCVSPRPFLGVKFVKLRPSVAQTV